MDNNKLASGLVLGAVLAILGIGLFLFMYFVVLSGANDATRLFASLLVPPLAMAVGFGAYYILFANND